MISSLQKETKEVDIKIAWVVASYIGIPVWLLGIWENWGDWKGSLLAVLGGIFMVARIVDFILRAWHANRHRQMKLEHEKMDLQERRGRIEKNDRR